MPEPAGAGSEGGAAPESGSTTAGASLPWPDQPGADGVESGGVGDLDEQLDESLGDFDETVMSGSGAAGEQGVDILDPLGTGNGSSASDQPIFEEGNLDEGDSMGGDGSMENAEVAQRAEAGGPSQGASGSGGAAGAGAPGKGGVGSGSQGGEQGTEEVIPIPGDVGDGRNDDIVLRQIRDAATKEKDPVLREKLWDEYRRIQAQR